MKNIITKRKSLGTEHIARICSVSRPTILSWMKKGKISFFVTPGGRRRVWINDLISFLKAHRFPLTHEMQREQVLRVLIVEDEKDVIKFIAKTVKKLYPTAEIQEATNDFVMGQKVASIMPSLIIMNIYMPGIRGIEICRMIREDSNYNHIKILAISGGRGKKHKEDVLSSGADDFITKPIRKDELNEKIVKLIPNQQYAK